jgi:uncharacterized protein YecE (DUF72 family)
MGERREFEFRVHVQALQSLHALALATVEAITVSTLRFSAEDEKLTRDGLDFLANQGKLGAVVAQFPISFKHTDENRVYLRKLIAMFRDYPLAIEIRHSSWNKPDVLREFSNVGVGFVNIDQPLLGKALPSNEDRLGIASARPQLSAVVCFKQSRGSL